jgi:D-alanine-D-alanine ligase-like ATP-grasp enzyme
MNRKKKESWILGKILRKLAPRLGAIVFLEPEWGIAGQITFKSGRKSYFRYNTVDLNPVGASDIAKDKDYANLFMGRLGYPIIPGSKTFFSTEWADAIGSEHRKLEDAYRYAQELGLPVVVKPNSGSQGSGVAIVYNKREFYRAMKVIFKRDRVALVQKPVSGRDYRLVVLDDEVISAYERLPLSVTGDGKSSVTTLIEYKQSRFNALKRDTRIKINDPRISEKLAHQNKSCLSIPMKGEKVYLLDNASLSTGGDSIDVTDEVHPAFRELSIRVTKDMGLRLCGVDLIIDGSIDQLPAQYWILEINAAPGLDHYVKSGRKQQRIVENLYLKVLKSLDRPISRSIS